MERLQKIISQAGVASRRAAEKLITDGRVMVNGQTVRELGTKADLSTDDIRVDARRIKGVERHRYILLYKPSGYMTTRADPQRRRTVVELLRGVKEYVYPVGRLDYDTEGLLLLTNDGDLAARLTHPSHGIDRTYEAHVAGIPDEEALERLRKGIPLDGRYTLPADAVLLTKGRSGPANRLRQGSGGPPKRSAKAEAGHYDRKGEGTARSDRKVEGVVVLTIREGRNRQVRRMLQAVGHPVRALKRTKIGPLADRQLKPGDWRELTNEEVRKLKALASRSVPNLARPAVKRPRGAPDR